MSEPDADGYFTVTVGKVIDETSDARTFVLQVPDRLRERFCYQAGQFCGVRVSIDGQVLERSYSMSSSPDTDDVLKITVKRISDGRVSNWMNDHLSDGGKLDVRPPAGRFCLQVSDFSKDRPIVAFSGGSGITPVISVVRTALATTTRPIRLLYVNRDQESVIFFRELDDLAQAHPDRFHLVHRFDLEQGFLKPLDVSEFVGDIADGDFYICGPAPFMDVVEQALRARQIERDRIFVERFVSPPELTPAMVESTAGSGQPQHIPENITIVLGGKEHAIAYLPGETVLEAARRAGLRTPYNCQMGDCGTCIAEVVEGAVTLRYNNVLTDEELTEEGLALTCQAIPVTPLLTVNFSD